MTFETYRPLALSCAVSALAMGAAAPAAAQTTAQTQLTQACGGLPGCASATPQIQGATKGGGAGGLGAFLNAAAAAVSAAAGQTVSPSAYGASPVVTPTNPVAAI